MGKWFSKHTGFYYTAEELYEDIRHGRDSQVKTVLRRNKHLRDSTFRSGHNILTALISYRCLSALYCLLSKGVNADVADARGYTALQLACRCGYEEFVSLLLENGADPNQPCAWNFRLDQHRFIDRNRVLEFCWREDGSQRRRRFTYKTFPLHEAIAYGEVDCARRLIACGADVHLGDQLGNTALMVAVVHNQTEAVRLVSTVSRASWFLDMPNALDVRPLQYAAHYANEESVDCLIEHGCDVSVFDDVPLNDPQLLYKTLGSCVEDPPLFQAVFGQNLHIVKRLLNAGARAETVIPIFLARRVASYGNPQTFLERTEGVEILEIILATLCDPVEYIVGDLYDQFNYQVVVPSIRLQNWDLLQTIYDVGLDLKEELLENIRERDFESYTKYLQLFPRPRTLQSICRLHLRHSFKGRLYKCLPFLDMPLEIEKYLLIRNIA